MSLRVGVQMDPASLFLWLLRFVCVSVGERQRLQRVCVHITLWQLLKLEVIRSILQKLLGMKGGAHIYNSKKKYIITLNQSTMLPVG